MVQPLIKKRAVGWEVTQRTYSGKKETVLIHRRKESAVPYMTWFRTPGSFEVTVPFILRQSRWTEL